MHNVHLLLKNKNLNSDENIRWISSISHAYTLLYLKI